MSKKLKDAITTEKIDKTQITLMLPTVAIQEINKIVLKIPNMTKNQFMSNLLMMGLDDVKLLDSVGLVAGIEYIRTIMEQTVGLFNAKTSKQKKISFKN